MQTNLVHSREQNLLLIASRRDPIRFLVLLEAETGRSQTFMPVRAKCETLSRGKKNKLQSFEGTILRTLRKVLCPLAMRSGQVHNSCSDDASSANSLLGKMDGALGLLILPNSVCKHKDGSSRIIDVALPHMPVKITFYLVSKCLS